MTLRALALWLWGVLTILFCISMQAWTLLGLWTLTVLFLFLLVSFSIIGSLGFNNTDLCLNVSISITVTLSKNSACLSLQDYNNFSLTMLCCISRGDYHNVTVTILLYRWLQSKTFALIVGATIKFLSLYPSPSIITHRGLCFVECW